MFDENNVMDVRGFEEVPDQTPCLDTIQKGQEHPREFLLLNQEP